MDFQVLAAFSMVVPFILGLRKSIWNSQRWLMLYFILGFTNTSIVVLFAMQGTNTVLSSYIYTPIQFYLIYNVLVDSRVKPKKLNIWFLAFAGLSFIEGWIGGFDIYPFFTPAISFIIISYLAIKKNLELIGKNIEVGYQIEKDGSFWINNAIFIFFSGALIFKMFMRYFQMNYSEAFFSVWHVYSVLIIVFYGILSYGIWLMRKAAS